MLARRLSTRPHLKSIPAIFSPFYPRRSSSSNKNGVKALIYPDSPSSKQHSDLPSFLAYADRVGLDRDSTVYRGTHYEYTVGQSLARYGFDLRRIGGAHDGGIDLIGKWTIPGSKGSDPVSSGSGESVVRVLVQCKCVGAKPGPRLVRELEGAFDGAPVGWKGSGTLGFLVSTLEATKGTLAALGRSQRPMGYLACGEGGEVRQMLWNAAAEGEGRMEGLGVVMKRFEDGREAELVLTKNGAPLLFVGE